MQIFIFSLLVSCVSGGFFNIKCHNGGTPFPEGGEICSCLPSFEGPLCQYHKCVHGIRSVDKCHCDMYWMGDLCEQPKCLHGVKINSTTCVCNENYTGVACQWIIQCVNGARNYDKCVCLSNWKGVSCNEIICGQGGSQISFEKCLCLDNYKPPYCDKLKREKGAKLESGTVLLVTLFIITSCTAPCLCCSFFIYRSWFAKVPYNVTSTTDRDYSQVPLSEFMSHALTDVMSDNENPPTNINELISHEQCNTDVVSEIENPQNNIYEFIQT